MGNDWSLVLFRPFLLWSFLFLVPPTTGVLRTDGFYLKLFLTPVRRHVLTPSKCSGCRSGVLFLWVALLGDLVLADVNT